MKIKLAHTLALFAIPVLANTPPEITNVRASQRTDTKLVDIYYDAADADGDLLKVRIEISDNDGVKYSVPAFSLTGDIGEGIAAGKDKHIVWDAGTDWDGEYSDQMRVKVYAIDAQGFPGLEWGNEVPPGGFLMGQDGGAEGSGPSRHVNIPWSYWLSKYEITAGQYCDYLNAALASGYVRRDGTETVMADTNMPIQYACPLGSVLCYIGDDQMIRWNVNNFEVATGKTNYPAVVTWYGAIAFARFYGYDLPTDAEWEKAARGPDNDDQDEHLCYPWGNECTSAYACPGVKYSSWLDIARVGYYDGNQIPVGPDTINGYGLYDVVGNVAEWTRSSGNDTVETYPTEDSLLVSRNLVFSRDKKAVRGMGLSAMWRRVASQVDVQYSVYDHEYANGFRVARRVNASDISAKSEGVEDFSSWPDCGYPNELRCSKETGTGVWTLVYVGCKNGSIVGSSSYCNFSDWSGSYSGYAGVFLPEYERQVYLIRVKIRNESLYAQSISCSSSLGSSDYVNVPAEQTNPLVMDIFPKIGASKYQSRQQISSATGTVRSMLTSTFL